MNDADSRLILPLVLLLTQDSGDKMLIFSLLFILM